MASIRTRILAAVLVPAAVFALLFFAGYVISNNRDRHAVADADISETTHQIASSLDASIREITQSVETASYLLNMNPEIPPDSVLIGLLGGIIERNPIVYSGSFALRTVRLGGSRDGAAPITGSDPILFVTRTDSGFATMGFQYGEIPEAWMEVYAAMGHDQKPAWSEPYFDDVGAGVRMITFGMPVLTAAGTYRGAITVDLGLPTMGAEIRDILELHTNPLVENYQVFVVDEADRIVFTTSEDLFGASIRDSTRFLPDPVARAEVIRVLHSRNAGVLLHTSWSSDAAESDHLVSARGMSESRFGVLTVMDHAVVGSYFAGGGLALPLFFFGIFGIVAFMLIRGVDAITNPILQLRDGIRRIGRGEELGDIPIEHDDEIGMLSTAFRDLVKQTRQQQQELDDMRWKAVSELLEALPGRTFYYTTDPDGVLDRFSESGEEFFGINRERIRHMSPETSRDGWEAVRIWHEQILKDKVGKLSQQFMVLGKDGAPRKIEITSRVVTDLNGRAKGVEGLVQDVTDLAKEADTLRAYLDASPDAFIVVSGSGRIILANHQAESLFGYDANEWPQLHIEALVPDEIRPRHEAMRLGFLKSESSRDLKLLENAHAKRKDGTLFPADIALRVLHTESGTIVCTVVRDITENLEAERQIKESREFLHQMIESSPAVIYAKTLDGRYSLVNSRFAEAVTGVADGTDLLGQTDHDLFPGAVARRMQGTDREVIETKGAVELEETVYVQGVPHQFLSIKFPITNAEGEVTGVCGISTDITQLKQKEQEIVENRAMLQAVINNTNTLIYTKDLEGRFDLVNDAVVESSGVPREAWVGKTVFDIHPRDVAQEMHRMDRQAIEEKRLISGEIVVPHKGKDRVFQAVKFPLYDASGKVTGMCGMSSDITDIRAGQRKLQQIYDAPLEGFAFVDTEGTILECNVGFAQTFGYSEAKEIEGQHFMLISAPQQADGRSSEEAGLAYLKSAFEGNSLRVSWKGKRKDGGEVPAMASMFRADFNGDPAVLITLRDITELQALIDKANAANEAKSAFLANMSHEIRTPMNAILGFSDLLAERITDPVQQEYLSTIRSSGKALLTLINDILDLSKVEAGKLSLQPRPVALGSVFHEIEQVFRHKALQKGLDLVFEVDEHVPEALFVDDVRLRQVMINLVGNAMKFTHHGFVKASLICDAISEDGSTADLTINVADSGIGIPHHQQERVFQAFEQSEGQSNAAYGGTGLGLAITLRLVHLMGGSLEIESEPGEGSIFTIHLHNVPIVSGDALPSSPREINTNLTFKPATILVADDIPSNQELIKGYLQGYGFTLLYAGNGKEVLELMENVVPDLILMDMKMPVMDGLEATQRIKARPEWSKVAVIALTASTMKSKEAEVRHATDAYLRKPVSKQTIVDVLTRFLPHEVAQEDQVKTEPRQESVAPELRVSADRQPELLALLEGKRTRVNDLLASQTINEVEAFGQEIVEMGAKFGHRPLEQWGEQLKTQAMFFQVVDMAATLRAFETLLNDLR